MNKLIKNDGFFYKIKTFFKNIFHKNKTLDYSENKKISNNFDENIIIKDNPEKVRLLNLQEMYRNKELSENTLSTEDIQKLNKLYDEQIHELQKKINQNIFTTESYKKQILSIKNKLA